MNKYTIINTVCISGKGLHYGLDVTITLHPAEDNFGIRFKRIDLEKQPLIKADVGYVVDTNRSTKLKQGDAEVNTVEHLMSALYAMGVDNILIEIDGPEVPILDGSAYPFVELIKKAGLQEQEAKREIIKIIEPIDFKTESGAEFTLLPSDTFEISTLIDFDSEVLGTQFAEYKRGDDYESNISKSKTFVFAQDVVSLLKQDLIKGGDLNNAIVISEKELSQEEIVELSKHFDVSSDIVKTKGIVNKDVLSYRNEPAVHKLLDFIGDLALVGTYIDGRIIAKKPGHGPNIEFVKVLKKEVAKLRKLRGIPVYDEKVEPLMDIEKIKSVLPHRYPFLLVDKILELSDKHVVGIKNVTGNESFFEGHFPNNPVFPGVLQIEALAQTGGILALSTVDDPENYGTYFVKLDNVKFKQMVRPGDTLILKLEIISPIRRGMFHMLGTAYVGDKIVSEGELTAQIIKEK